MIALLFWWLLAGLIVAAGWTLASRHIARQRQRDFDTYGIRYEPRWNGPRTEKEAWERYDEDQAMQWERESR